MYYVQNYTFNGYYFNGWLKVQIMMQPKYMTHKPKPKPIWFSVLNPSSFPNWHSNFPLHSSAPLLRRRCRRRRRKFRLV